ncbi:MAG TPA: bifunctional 4-hydroxy-2-oxoglutarate aldolase/2-dehydro-3-deoxy-phosphogluconate aldolase [Candidatus Acidoferrum sp.]|nr:bifunctional 4-hydroxy-2-oxoglutarate aldolase/2-dehydro-3-deoxy-phosphogluconate aldolase [Candidatus Acidoferrum sp.]
MNKQEVRAWVERVGIVPVVRAGSPEEALFAAQAIARGGISIVEITMTVPGAIDVIEQLAKNAAGVLVGAGTVVSAESTQKCIDAGARFLVSPGFNAAAVAAARDRGVLMMAGALTPTEVMAAWEAGADFIKVFPCGNMGGPKYIQALKGPFPQIPMVPTGGVNLETAADYIRAGAAALGVGGELVQKDALKDRNADLLSGLAKQFVELVKQARNK